jgi:uncharacterized protein YjbJ (UPF0337 family)
MEWTQIAKDWPQVQNQFTTKWSKLTDKDLEKIAGKRETLIGTLETRYSMGKAAAEKDVDSFAKHLRVQA